MSDTCIVCLGDLSTEIDGVAAQSTTSAKSPLVDGTSDVPNQDRAPPTADDTSNHDDGSHTELIAHLQPCGHDLHNECLKPWVERANSCPICRANFHMVELMHRVGGEVVTSYTVEDRTQVADIDPSMFLEIPDEDEEEACQECGEDDNEDVLMYCDGCGKLWHTYCVDLQDVPYASWFCDACDTGRIEQPTRAASRRARTQVGRRRTRGMERRRRTHSAMHDDGWNQVWQSVWSRLNIDLDFPFEDDEAPATVMRRHRYHVESNRREHEAYERRRRVAELAGAGGSFREIESTLLNGDGPRRRRATTAPRETEEEVAAWDAFAAAAAEPQPQPQLQPQPQPESSTAAVKRKRRSPASSPAHSQIESRASPSQRKRRRTSTPAAPPLMTNNVHEQSLAQRGSSTHHASPPPPRQPRPQTVLDTTAPSFLQSLLQEVEDSVSTSAINYRPSPMNASSPGGDQHSPRPSSPVTSNHSSPRALSATPPPMPGIRPGSPSGLTSTVQPVYPLLGHPPARPKSPVLQTQTPNVVQQQQQPNGHRPITHVARPKPRRPRIPVTTVTSDSERSRSYNTSPVRHQLSANSKADVQKLVSAALKPHYHDQKISADQYTAINRDVSRMLYDQIGDFEALDLEGRARWEKIAGDEVKKAVSALTIST